MYYINGLYDFPYNFSWSYTTYPNFTLVINGVVDDKDFDKITIIYDNLNSEIMVSFINNNTLQKYYVWKLITEVWVEQPTNIYFPFQQVNDSNLPVLMGFLTPLRMQLNLYYMSCETNRINKANYLTNVAYLQGALKESTSVTNPTIAVNLPEYVKFNYAFIPLFERYYFLEEPISLKNNLWNLKLKVDVLYSNASAILGNKAQLLKCEDTSYINKMLDDKAITEADYTLDFIAISKTTGCPLGSDITTDNCIVIQTMGDETYGT